MAYTPSSNPVVAYVQPTSSARIKQWIYRATDPVLTVATDGYFSDGFDRGMTVGDVIWHLDSGANEWVMDTGENSEAFMMFKGSATALKLINMQRNSGIVAVRLLGI